MTLRLLCVFGSILQTPGVDNTFRKKFDVEEFRERAREREKKVSLSSISYFSISDLLIYSILKAKIMLGLLVDAGIGSV